MNINQANLLCLDLSKHLNSLKESKRIIDDFKNNSLDLSEKIALINFSHESLFHEYGVSSRTLFRNFCHYLNIDPKYKVNAGVGKSAYLKSIMNELVELNLILKFKDKNNYTA